MITPSKVDWKKYKDNITGGTEVTFGDDHVGGCNIYGDPCTELPKTWKYLVDTLNIKSVVDVGCGFGFHSKYFKEVLDCEVLGIEGSSKVVELSLLPENIVWHDYTKGAYPLSKVYDLGWCIECVEHIEEQYIPNFMETFKSCRYVAMTHGTPGQGGYHHVNCQPMEYWLKVFSENGFELEQQLTDTSRKFSEQDNQDFLEWLKQPEDSRPYRGPASENSKYLIESHTNRYSSPVPWGFFFGMNGLVFKNTKVN
jgi:SAM-dependent methyltransferase